MLINFTISQLEQHTSQKRAINRFLQAQTVQYGEKQLFYHQICTKRDKHSYWNN